MQDLRVLALVVTGEVTSGPSMLFSANAFLRGQSELPVQGKLLISNYFGPPMHNHSQANAVLIIKRTINTQLA